MNHSGHRLNIRQDDLKHCSITPDPDAPAQRVLAAGQLRLQVERFALTANNITYAAFGQAMKYWQFFPAADPAWGCLPVWGFATVLESLVDGVAVGRRIYGYLPAGTHLVVQPDRLNARGFVDAAAHRQGLAAVYNQYSFCDGLHAAAPAQDAHQEGLRAVLQPLFMTAFLIDDQLADQQFFGAQQLLLSSASSKTAMATAFCLSQRRGSPDMPQVIGLTSTANRAFVEGLKLYDQVLGYDEVTSLPAATSAAYIDFAGNAALRRTVHTHFGDQLKLSSSIGGTHWTELGSGSGLPGPRPTLFFAPEQARLRSAPPPAGWGREGLEQRMGQAWSAFIQRADGSQPWVQLVDQRGSQALMAAYDSFVQGRADPQQGLMLQLSD